MQFTGDPLPKDKIAELVPIEREGSVDQDLLEDSALRIKEYLQQQGYWKAEVAPPERKEADGHLTLVFNVKRGSCTTSRRAGSRSAATSRSRSKTSART